jgi:hypothetical protein
MVTSKVSTENLQKPNPVKEDSKDVAETRPYVPHPELIRYGSTEHTPEIGKLAAALSKFQSKIEQPTKDKTAEVTMKSGGKYKYKYCDLATIIKAAQPLLGECELAVIQSVSTEPGVVMVVTTVAHSSGQWLRDKIGLPTGDDKPQSYGSSMTYARRYGYCAPLGISADEDDDAGVSQDASGVNKNKTDKPQGAQGQAQKGKGKEPDKQEVIKKVVGYFAQKKVDRGMLEKFLNVKITDIEDKHLDVLREIKNQLEGGKTTVEAAFGLQSEKNPLDDLNEQFPSE